MRASIGVNMRVTGHYCQGDRKHMEDKFSVAYQQTEDERDLEYAYFGIFDGHGGSEAAIYAKEHLMETIVKQNQFWSDDDADVLRAIRNGYIITQMNMWKELEKWPKIIYGLPSTAGTTASVAFIRRGKIYIGHVGDSAIVLGYQVEGKEKWSAIQLTIDHKPDTRLEMQRIYNSGGKVMVKAGISRVAWKRYIMESGKTHEQEIPFLAMARSLGDYWSYNTFTDEFIVSPDPDVGVLEIDPSRFRCLIFGTDGLWNMIPPDKAVELVQNAQRHNEQASLGAHSPNSWQNPSKILVDHAISNWASNKVMADNTTVITVMMDPPGPPRNRAPLTVPLRPPTTTYATAVTHESKSSHKSSETHEETPCRKNQSSSSSERLCRESGPQFAPPLPPVSNISNYSSGDLLQSSRNKPEGESDRIVSDYGNYTNSYFINRLMSTTEIKNSLEHIYSEINADLELHQCVEAEECENNNNDVVEELVKPEEAKTEPLTDTATYSENLIENETKIEKEIDEDKSEEVSELSVVEESESVNSQETESESIQINEVSSSSPVNFSLKPKKRKRKSLINTASGHSRNLRSQDTINPANNAKQQTLLNNDKNVTVPITNPGTQNQRKSPESKVPVPVHSSKSNVQTKKIVPTQQQTQASNKKLSLSQGEKKQVLPVKVEKKINVDKDTPKSKKTISVKVDKVEVKGKVVTPKPSESSFQSSSIRVTRSKDVPADISSKSNKDNGNSSAKKVSVQDKGKVIAEPSTLKRNDLCRGAVVTRHKTSISALTFCSKTSLKLKNEIINSECHKENLLSPSPDIQNQLGKRHSNNTPIEIVSNKRRCTRQGEKSNIGKCEQHQDVTSSLIVSNEPESSSNKVNSLLETTNLKPKIKINKKEVSKQDDNVTVVTEVHSTTIHLEAAHLPLRASRSRSEIVNKNDSAKRVLRSAICVTELKDKRPILRSRNSVTLPTKGQVRRRVGCPQNGHHNLRKRFTK